jgi:hypothetical protein
MTDERSGDEGSKKKPRPDAEDQLSPSRALRESTGKSGGPRVGDSGPVANPTLSFPDEPDDDDSKRTP